MNKNTLIVLVVILLFNTLTLAGPFKITNRQGTDVLTEAIFDEIENKINDELPNATGETYAPHMANAATAAMKSTGSDYSNDLDFLMVSANIGAAVASKDYSTSDLIKGDVDEEKLDGIGLSGTLTIGMNMGTFLKKNIGFIDPSRLDLFVNFMSADKDSNEFSISHKNLGLHARYHLHEGYSLFSQSLLKWGGVFLTTGIEYSKLDLNLVENFSETETQGTASATFAGDGQIGVKSSVTSIPIEVSTYIQAFYVLTLYTGVGVDINFGRSRVIGTIDGDVTVSGTASGTGDANLDLSGSGKPDSFSTRAFVGAQINIPVVKIYAQLSKHFGTDTTSVNAGLKFIW